MGCTESSTSVIPFHNHIPIEPLYVNEDYSLAQPEPVVMITAASTPNYVKSALKKTSSDGRGTTERLSLFNRKLPPLNKSVNFDEKVLVKARTPTPSKIWYEKASSTMPMRRRPRNDDDDHDYDDEEEIDTVSSDEEQENDEQLDTEPQISTMRPPTPFRKQNQINAFRHTTDPTGLMSPTNAMRENEYVSPTMQQPSPHMNTYASEIPNSSPVNRIKVRRRLLHLGPSQIAPAPLYRSPGYTTTVPAYQHPAQTAVVLF